MAYNKTNWENLPSTNTPLYDVNLNKIENKLSDLDTNKANVETTIYSENETRIGTWINGKPLYRQVVIGTSPSDTDVTEMAGYFSSGKNIIRHEAYLTVSNGNIIKLNYYHNSGDYAYMYINDSNHGLAVNVGHSAYTSRPVTFILEYTKTTD